MTQASQKKRIAIVTVGRSDFGLYEPLLSALKLEDKFDYGILVGGAHFSELYGSTINAVEASQHPIWGKVDIEAQTDSLGVSLAMGDQVKGFAHQYSICKPDLVFVLGDRYEMIAACLACIPFNIPVAHIAGGSLTLGAIDDAFRHAITKLSHLHFTETAEYAKRLCQMGESADNVFYVGSFSLDNIKNVERYQLDEFNQVFNTHFDSMNRFVLVTYHPETRRSGSAAQSMSNIIRILEKSGEHVLYTYPNADAEGSEIIELINNAINKNSNHYCVPHLGTRGYYSALNLSKAVLGNSSSGIIETASFKRAVVDVGKRQDQRLASSNVIHCDSNLSSLDNALTKALSLDFQKTLANIESLYGDGMAAKRVVSILSHDFISKLESHKAFEDHEIEIPQFKLHKIDVNS